MMKGHAHSAILPQKPRNKCQIAIQGVSSSLQTALDHDWRDLRMIFGSKYSEKSNIHSTECTPGNSLKRAVWRFRYTFWPAQGVFQGHIPEANCSLGLCLIVEKEKYLPTKFLEVFKNSSEISFLRLVFTEWAELALSKYTNGLRYYICIVHCYHRSYNE